MKVVRELGRDGLLFDQARRNYGILGSWTVQKWEHKYRIGSRAITPHLYPHLPVQRRVNSNSQFTGVMRCLATHLLKPARFICGAKARCRYQFPALNKQRLLRIDPHSIRHPLTLQGQIALGQGT